MSGKETPRGRRFELLAIPLVVALLTGSSAPFWWRWIVPAAPMPHMSELMLRVNLQGSDIANLDNAAINTAGACSEACFKNNDCRAMTFVQHPSGQGGVCWLKNAVPPPTPNPAMTSAVKIRRT
jgi:hypothetical protein